MNEQWEILKSLCPDFAIVEVKAREVHPQGRQDQLTAMLREVDRVACHSGDPSLTTEAAFSAARRTITNLVRHGEITDPDVRAVDADTPTDDANFLSCD